MDLRAEPSRRVIRKLSTRVFVVLALMVVIAGPAWAGDIEWQQEDEYSGIASWPYGNGHVAATGTEVHMLSPDEDFDRGRFGSVLPIEVDHLDIRDVVVLGGGRTLTVFDPGRGEGFEDPVVAEIDWPAPPAPQITDVAISGSKAVVAVNGGVRLFDLDTLAPAGTLIPADPTRDVRLGAGNDILLVAFYPRLPAPHPGYASTQVQVFENLTPAGTITLIHSRRESGRVPADLAPAGGGGIVVAHELRDPIEATLDLYSSTGAFVAMAKGLGDVPLITEVALATDICLGVVGTASYMDMTGSVGFKYTSPGRDLGCFLDTSTNIFESAITWLGREGITTGCNPPLGDLYCPGRSVTRGEMAAFLVRARGYTDDGGGGFFTDTAGSVFQGAIDKLAAAGVTKGCNPPTNDRFCPTRPVTRGEMAAFMVRAYGFSDPGTGDYFTDDDNSVFEGAIDRLRAAGVTQGCRVDRYCPDRNITRGEMAAFLKRATEA